ncbi:MAG: glycine cleavage system protein GcvH [Verrucomicrobia bacterium]|nr:glycine cleavage system protein GcvH [Verrucomicrobiota bacterium]MCF7708219.1 glycine cleavage system protein GcvH [Verrucomicrobiota bacterium]
MNIPEDLKYTESHEWVRVEDGVAVVGITDHAQQELTDIVFVELPQTGDTFKAGDPCAVVESVKTASDIYCPLSGEVIECNEALNENPDLVNSEPYKGGWFFKIKLEDTAEVEKLMNPDTYKEFIGQ